MIPGWVSLITVLFIVGLIGLTLLLVEIDRKEKERDRAQTKKERNNAA